MATVYVLRGIPGSGKSYLSGALQRRYDDQGQGVVIASADHYFTDAQGNYKHDGSKLGEAHNQCFRIFLAAMHVETDVVIVDNTNSHPIEIAPYMLGATSMGYQPRIVTIKPDIELSRRRQIHGCPMAIIQGMAEAVNRPLPEWWPQMTFDSSEQAIATLCPPRQIPV